MKALTLGWPMAPGPNVGAMMRAVAACPPPPIAGLCSRHFRVEGGGLRGRYHFETIGELEVFAREPLVDPASAMITRDTVTPAPSIAVDDVAPHEVFERPIFILAVPRAGGRLLAKLLATSNDLWTIEGGTDGIVEGISSLHPARRGWDSHQLTDLDAGADTVRALRSALAAELRDSHQRRLAEIPDNDRPPRVRLIEGTSENALRVPFLAATFPDACFVFVHRDARQNVSSLLEAWHDDAFIRIPSLPGWPRGAWHCLLPDGWRDYGDAPLVDVAAFQWAAANQRVLDDLEWLARDRWTVVEYAELLAWPRGVIERVLALAGLDMGEALDVALARAQPLFGGAPSSPIKWRSNCEFRESALAPHNVLRGRLREIGGPSAPPPPRSPDSNIRFACFLEQLCIDPAPFEEDWIVHPSYQFQLGATVPLGLVRRTRFRERFVRDFPVMWVEDDATQVFYPFWVRREQAHALRRLVPGRPPPPMGPDLAARLAAAGVLVSAAGLARRREEADALARSGRSQFAGQRFCVLPSLMHPDHAAALAQYYDALIASGAWAFGDAQVAQRHGWHNEPVARYFHHQLTGFVGRVAGEPVRPSYCYVSAYRGGEASLRPHVDRKQCVFTVSLWIRDRASAGPEPWPLWFHAPAGIVSVTQSAADAVLFRGCELPHWRDPPPPGGASTILIFHYVPRDFVGVLD
jgi:Sulfotransferase family